MKKLYNNIFIRCFILLLLAYQTTSISAQCPYGEIAGSTAYDTSIKLGSGIVNTQVKFPKFDPQNGMVTCVKLCVTIKGIIDTIAMENYTNTNQTGSYSYVRKDTITGPGIPTYLTSNATINSPVFPLGPNNGTFFSGPDFYSQGPDTVLTRVLCSTISDSTAIVQFYGINDSVTYNYNVNAILNDIVTGGSAFKFVLSSAIVNFNFQYCTCPASLLPLNIQNLTVSKANNNNVLVNWIDILDQSTVTSGYYIVQVSEDGVQFKDAGAMAINASGSTTPYSYLYTTQETINRNYWFRIKQVYKNGYIRYSVIKQIYLGNSPVKKFTLFPNPSTGIVGIKFDALEGGKKTLEIFDSRGQKIMQKQILVAESSFQQLGTLPVGIYWVKISNEQNRLPDVSLLLIK